MNGAELKTWRESVGLSATQLAGLLGVETRSVNRWESETMPIPAGILAEISKLDHHIHQMLQWIEQRHQDDPVLYRYREPDDLKTHDRELWDAGVSIQAHASVLWKISRQRGTPIRFFDPVHQHLASIAD